MAGRATFRGPDNPGWDRPRLFFPAALFRDSSHPPYWSVFLDDFQRHWPTDKDNTYVHEVPIGIEAGQGRPIWLPGGLPMYRKGWD
jgi:hypothetical protein